MKLRGIIYPLYTVLAGAVVLGNMHDYGEFPVGTAIFMALIVVAMVVWGETVDIRTGLEECEEGFIERHSYGRRLLRISELERFDHRKTLTLDRVYAVRRDGSSQPILGFVQGQPVVWDGGETRDIVGVLNERLRARQVAAGSVGSVADGLS